MLIPPRIPLFFAIAHRCLLVRHPIPWRPARVPRTRRISPRRCAGRAVNQLELLRAGSAPLYTVECWVMSQDYGKVSGTERIAQGRRVGGLGPRRWSSLHRASLIKQAPVATCGPSACTSLVAAPHTSRAPVRRGGRKRADCRFASPTVLGPTPTPRSTSILDIPWTLTDLRLLTGSCS